MSQQDLVEVVTDVVVVQVSEFFTIQQKVRSLNNGSVLYKFRCRQSIDTGSNPRVIVEVLFTHLVTVGLTLQM